MLIDTQGPSNKLLLKVKLMKDITIKYEGLKKTSAIDNFIHRKLHKLQRFINNYRIIVSLKEATPHKKALKNIQYGIVFDLKDLGKGRKQEITINYKGRDLYKAIEESVSKLIEQVRKEHQKFSNHYKNFKQVLKEEYMDLTQREAINII
jgi:ribosomal subunit interface protein